MNERVKIIDIAERAGVSSGTVDRVLHNRPNVYPIGDTNLYALCPDMTAKHIGRK